MVTPVNKDYTIEIPAQGKRATGVSFAVAEDNRVAVLLVDDTEEVMAYFVISLDNLKLMLNRVETVLSES